MDLRNNNMGDLSIASAIIYTIILIVGFAVAGLLFSFIRVLTGEGVSVIHSNQEKILVGICAAFGIGLMILIIVSPKDVSYQSPKIDPEIPLDKKEDKISVNEAVKIVRKRYARGEITKEKYTEIRSRL